MNKPTKNKKFEQSLFNTFLENKIIRAKQGKSFDFDRCNEAIKKLTNTKIKQKVNVVIDKINEAHALVNGHKPVLKIKYNKLLTKDMYPKLSIFTMKIIAARVMGKTIFLTAFLHSLINRSIAKHEDIYIFFVLHLMNRTNEDHLDLLQKILKKDMQRRQSRTKILDYK